MEAKRDGSLVPDTDDVQPIELTSLEITLATATVEDREPEWLENYTSQHAPNQ